MTGCSRDSNPPELLEQLGNSADDWMLEGRCDVQKKLGGGREYVLWKCVCVGSSRGAQGSNGKHYKTVRRWSTISTLTLLRQQVFADIVLFLKIKIKIFLIQIGGCR
jgi:hypothetical protein